MSTLFSSEGVERMNCNSMDIKTLTTIVIPCYNEEHSIGNLLDSYLRQGFKNFLVVDDGSNDGTASVSRQLGTEVISHNSTQGYNLSVLHGLYSVKTAYALLVPTLVSTNRGAIDSFLTFALAGKYSLLISGKNNILYTIFPNFNNALRKKHGLFLPEVSMLDFMFLDKDMLDIIKQNTIGTETRLSNEIIRLAVLNKKKVGVWNNLHMRHHEVLSPRTFSMLLGIRHVLREYQYGQNAFPDSLASKIVIQASLFSVIYVILRILEKVFLGN